MRREALTPRLQTMKTRFATAVAWPIAVLLAGASLGGLLTSAYARETPAWTAQAVGQDWFDLLIAAPWIAICARGARTGSYRWRVLLAGAYAYTVYEMAIYAFAIHFNALFLAYCAMLGLASFGLIALAIDLSRRVERVDPRAARLAGVFLVALGGVFGLLWLAEDIPAILRDEPSPALAATGLFTNPVHVIDYALVLPAHVLAGVWLFRAHAAGELLAPIVLAFGVLMAFSIGGMMLVMHAIGAAAAAPVTVAMLLVGGLTATVLGRVWRREPPSGAPTQEQC